MAPATDAPCRWHVEKLHDAARLGCLGGWSLGAVQTTPGTLSCTRREFTTDGLQWLDEDLREVTVHMFGKAPPGSLVFGVMLSGDAEVRVNGRAWRASELAVGPAGGHGDIVVPPSRIATLVVQRGLLAQHLLRRDGVRLDNWASDIHPLLVRMPSLVEATRFRLLRLADDLARELPGMAPSATQARALRSEILDVLADVVVAAVGAQYVPMRRTMQTEVVRQARDVVGEHAGEALQVEDLCRATRVSRRSLQRCFVAVLGVTPVEYLRLRRLGDARRLLMQGAPGRCIQDVLAQLGIWHASRFAAEYRALFGELPSETLRPPRRH